MCTSQTHLKIVIHQNWTWMKKWNTSPSKAMKTCSLFPIFTELEPERMSGGYTFHYVLGTICIKLRCFEWSQNYTEKNKVQKDLCTFTRKQLWSEVANENTWTLFSFLSPVITQVNINLIKLLFCIQSRNQISKCIVYSFVYGRLLFTKVYTRLSGSSQYFMLWEEMWKTVNCLTKWTIKLYVALCNFSTRKE